MACNHAQPVIGCPDCDRTIGSARPSQDLEFPGRGVQVGRYLLLDQVGEGAMGMVFAAFDPELDRRVAIKLLRPTKEDAGSMSSGQSRLLREAQAMAKLSHPNVIPIYDTGPYQDGVFLAMELVEGHTLRAWMAEPHPWRDVLRLFMQAGEGLSAAHQAGIIHRDFKPSNVLIGKDGRARVGDFGIARTKDAPPPAPAPNAPVTSATAGAAREEQTVRPGTGGSVLTAPDAAPETADGVAPPTDAADTTEETTASAPLPGAAPAADDFERLLAEEEEIERRTRNEHHETPHFRKESD